MTDSANRLRQAMARMHEPYAGVLCLDFANSVEPRGGPPPIDAPPDVGVRDELTSYDELVAWAVHKGVLTPDAGTCLIDAGTAHEGGMVILDRALALRDTVYRVFWQLANDGHPAHEDLATIMREYTDATSHADLVITEDGTQWDWSEAECELARPLWPVAKSATDLLATGDRHRIKVCPGPGRPPLPCAWLFYDTSKNGSRRWCSMSDCGSVTKAKRQTARRRASRTGNAT
jgi:predicted RNA-binding Zn ribbon-like protein